jgi:uncharacterized protein (DUF433 family)
MILPDYLDDTRDGLIQFKGSRIGLHHVVRRYNDGYSAEAIAADIFPTLTLPVVYKAIGFYLDNRPAIDALVATMDRQIAAQADELSSRPTLRELRLRLEAGQAAEAT